MRTRCWNEEARSFLADCFDKSTGRASSVPGGPGTLYGTCYAALGAHYLGAVDPLSAQSKRFIAECQVAETGQFVGPELSGFSPEHGATHDRDHLRWHSTCAALAACQEFGISPISPITSALRFCDTDYLTSWLNAINLKDAWLEGNNLLFVGQLLVYLRDVERVENADAALSIWFDWLDTHLDPRTSLWGTDGFCSVAAAVYGGYHQLLVYYHENHSVTNPEGMIDAVLSLQHRDGGFNPTGNGGACEDVDAIDILVNLYKRVDYKRAAIRLSIRRCCKHILATQNEDGGFPYNQNCDQSHMGIPGTQAGPNVSSTFATWFRVHTLALAAEILPHDRPFRGRSFQFSNNLSMGWHRDPCNYQFVVPPQQAIAELGQFYGGIARSFAKKAQRRLVRIKRHTLRQS